MTAGPFVHPLNRSLRVLVVDDNPDAADSLAELLRLVGCEVQTCYCGETVVPLAEQFEPDAGILDLRMPRVDGLEAARRLREWAGERMLLLIALSGVTGPEVEESSRLAGFDHYILKPGDANEIFEEFAAFIRKMESTLRALV